MSDKASSIRILNDAKRLNMMDGHFVWLWIDTAAVINVKNTTDETADIEMLKRSEFDEFRYRRNVKNDAGLEEFRFENGASSEELFEELRVRRRAESDSIDKMNVNYLLQNDQYLLFNNNNNNFEAGSSVTKNRRTNKKHQRKDSSDNTVSQGGTLPTGLLSIKPLPIKVDRHLVKGAVRLLVSVLKNVLDRSPTWMIRNLVTAKNNGCWKNVVIKETSFIMDFGK